MSFSPYSYKPVTDNDLKLYNEVLTKKSFLFLFLNDLIQHKDGVEQEIRSKHGVSDDFELKPVTFFARPMCGLDLTYKVKEIKENTVENEIV